MLDLFFSNGAGWFTVLAACGTSVFLLRLVLLFAGHHVGGDVHADVDGGHGVPGDGHTDSSSAFKALSLQTIAAFMMGFGWGGLGALKGSGLPWAPTLVIAGVSGVAMVWLLALLLKGIHDLQSSGNVLPTDSIGSEGDVYLTVPGNARGSGQVRVNIGDRQRIYTALTDAEPLPTGTRIKVVGVNSDNTLTVVRA